MTTTRAVLETLAGWSCWCARTRGVNPYLQWNLDGRIVVQAQSHVMEGPDAGRSTGHGGWWHCTVCHDEFSVVGSACECRGSS